MRTNSLYLLQNQLKAVGGGKSVSSSKSSKKRGPGPADEKVGAHQAIDLYAKPSDLGRNSVCCQNHAVFAFSQHLAYSDEEAKVIKHKAWLEYERAFKAIRKVRPSCASTGLLIVCANHDSMLYYA
jgi:hypothetical protein